MTKKTIARTAATIAFLLLCSLPGFSQQSNSVVKPRVAVFGFNNLTGDGSFDIPAETSTSTLVLSLRMLNMYEVESSNLILRNISDESLSKYCKDLSIDYVMYGTLTLQPDGGQDYSLAVFDNAKSATTIHKKAVGSTVQDVFGITDDIILSVLASVSGRHVGFGSLAFANTGDALDYEVEIDGVPLERNAGNVDHILSGSHQVTVYQGTGSNRLEVLSQNVDVAEGKSSPVRFALEKGKEPDPKVIIQTVYVDRGGSAKPHMVPVSAGSMDRNWQLTQTGDLLMSATEITQAQYKAVMGDNPGKRIELDLPVDSVSWYDAIEFCNRLSASEGLDPAYEIDAKHTVTWKLDANGYRLPTIDEWLYAAAAGSAGANLPYSGGSDLSKVAWYGKNSHGRSHSVGELAPNAFGLYDMSGNLTEWCWASLGNKKSDKNPLVRGIQSHAIDSQTVEYVNSGACFCGGNWSMWGDDTHKLDKPLSSVYFYASKRYDTVGFRVCRNSYSAKASSATIGEKTVFSLYGAAYVPTPAFKLGPVSAEGLESFLRASYGLGIDHRFSEHTPLVFVFRVQGEFPKEVDHKSVNQDYYKANFAVMGGLALRLPVTGAFAFQPELDAGTWAPMSVDKIGTNQSYMMMQVAAPLRFFSQGAGFEIAPLAFGIMNKKHLYVMPGVRAGLLFRLR